MSAEKVSSPVGVGQRYAQYNGTDPGKQVVNVAGEIPSAERRIPVQDLLKDLSTGACRKSTSADLVEESTGWRLVRMIRPSYVHRDIGVNKDFQRRPASISTSIWSMSEVGASSAARRSTASSPAECPDRSKAACSAIRTQAPFDMELR